MVASMMTGLGPLRRYRKAPLSRMSPNTDPENLPSPMIRVPPALMMVPPVYNWLLVNWTAPDFTCTDPVPVTSGLNTKGAVV